MRQKLRSLILWALGALMLLVVAGGALLNHFIPYFINLDALKAKIETSIEDSTGIQTDIEELSIHPTLFRGVHVVFDNNVLYDPDDVRVAKAGQVHVYVRYFPLLKGETSISGISFNNMEVYVGENSFWFRLKKPEAPSEVVYLKDARLEFNNYHIIADRYFDNINQYRLDGKNLVLHHVKSHKNLVLRGSGTGYFGASGRDERLGEFNLLVKAHQRVIETPDPKLQDVKRVMLVLNNVQYKPLTAIVQSFDLPIAVNGNLQRLFIGVNGTGKAKNIRIEANTKAPTEVSFFGHEYAFHPGRMLFAARLYLNSLSKHMFLENLVFELKSRQFFSQTRGRVVLKTPVEHSMLNLDTRTSWMSMETLKRALQQLPDLDPHHRRLINTVDGYFATHLVLKGTPATPQVTGDVKVTQVNIRALEGGKSLARRLKGTLTMHSSHLFEVKRLYGIVADSAFALKGQVNIRQRTMDTRLQAQNLDLSQVHRLIRQFFPNTPYGQHVYPTGRLKARLHAYGPWQKPKFEANLGFKSVSVYHRKPWTPLVQNITGNLVIERELLAFRKLQGTVGKAPITLLGTADTRNNRINVNFRTTNLHLGTVQQLLRDISPLIGRPWPWVHQYTLGGLATADVALRGRADKPTVSGSASVTDFYLADPTRQWRLSQTQARLLFREAGTVVIDRLAGQFQGTAFTASGRVYDGFQRLDLTLKAPSVDVGALLQMAKSFGTKIPEALKASGKVALDLAFGGTVKQPQLTGTARLSGVQVTEEARGITLNNLAGLIRLQPQQIVLEKITGSLKAIPFTLAGTVAPTFETYRLTVQSRNVPLEPLIETLAAFAPQTAAPLLAADIRSGVADLDIVLTPPLPQGLGGTVVLRHLEVFPHQLGVPIQVSTVSYTLDSGQIQFPSGGIQVGGLSFNMKGYASAQGYQLSLKSHPIPVSFLRDQRAFVERIIDFPIPTLYNTQGEFELDARLSETVKDVTIRFSNAGASMAELKYPIYDINGTLNLDLAKGFKASTDGLTLRYANSPLTLDLDMNGLQDLYLETTGTMAPLLVNDVLMPAKGTSVAYAAIPFDINLTGQVGRLFGGGEGTHLNLFFNFNVESLFSDPKLEKPLKAGTEALKEATLSLVAELNGSTLKVERTRFQAGKNSGVLLEGVIEEIFTPEKRRMALSIFTDPVLNLAAFAEQYHIPGAEGLAGIIEGKVTLVGDIQEFITQGQVNINHVEAPALDLVDLDGTIRFQDDKAFLDVRHFQIPGVDAAFTATVASLLQYPLPVIDFNLQAQQFIVSLYAEWTNNIITGKIKQGAWEKFFPNMGYLGSLPFEILNGQLDIAEGILNNLIVTNYASSIRVYPNTYFVLEDIRAESAGGHVTGNFSMSPRDNNFMTVHLNIDKMKANAVSRILLNVSNQIFGDLSGVIDYTTEGRTPEAMLASTNGFADLQIENGRLPAIAKIENLLVAANTISGGLANLNLNSLFRLAAPFNTDYFAHLTGTFKMVDGIIHTNDMLSDGQNLDLHISGQIRMVDGFADLLVRGNMDREIGGILGPLGDVSVGRFLGLLPPLRSLISRIPGIGFIPGFGGPSESGVEFQVKVEGPVIDPGSIKDFQWIQ